MTSRHHRPSFAATRSVTPPRAYLFRNEPGLKPVLDNLLAHGIAVEELTAPIEAEVEGFAIDEVKRSTRTFQGHREVKLAGRAKAEKVDFPAGSLLVRTAQPLGTLAAYLRDPDGLRVEMVSRR